MRNLALIFTALIFGAPSASAVTLEDKVAPRNAYGYNNSFIFVENGITFSVYPDGEFDFYIDQVSGVNASVNFRNTNITFNSGFNYNPFVQYDDYGAVIQVENIPIYYDFYGRVTQIGNVDIRYNNGRVHRLGGMFVYYNNNGFYSHHSGFINIYNRNYVYAPFHGYFVRPALGFCLVYNQPYRRFYTPVRYTYYAPYYNNSRVVYANIGREHRYDNRISQRRANVYRNDSRVAVRENSTRRTEAYRANNTVNRNGSGRTNADVNTVSRSDFGRSNTTIERNSSVTRTDANRGSTTVQRNSSVTRSDANRGETTVQRNSSVVRSETNRNTAPVNNRTSVNSTVNKSQNATAPRSTEANRSSSNVVRSDTRNSSPAPQRSVSERPSSVTKGSNGSSTISSRSAAPRAEARVSTNNTRSTPAATQRSSSARRSQ